MDDLDRLYIELVELLRQNRPEALEEPVTVAQLYRDCVPYQRVRETAKLSSHDDYEAALSRLLAGERGYLLTDALDMQAEVKAGLQETYPDARRFHAFSDVKVRLNPERIPPPGDIRYAPPELQEEVMQQVEEERLAQVEAKAAELERSELRRQAEEAAAVEASSSESQEQADQEGAATAEPGVGACAICGSTLPDQIVMYCPYCGERQRYVCPACGAETQLGWRFCGECGESLDRSSSESA